MRRNVLLLAACLLASSYAWPEEGVVDIEIKLIRPISVQKSNDMLFPDFVAGVGGTIRSDDTGVNNSTGANALLLVSGEPEMTYTVTGYEDGMKLSNGGYNVAVALEIIGLNTRALDVNGADQFYVRGTADISASIGANPQGIYTGKATLMVSYN
jgi:hypothetical protein